MGHHNKNFLEPLDPLMDTHDAAEFLAISYNTLVWYRCHGGGPDYVKLGARLVRYRVSDLLAYIKERRSSLRAASALDSHRNEVTS